MKRGCGRWFCWALWKSLTIWLASIFFSATLIPLPTLFPVCSCFPRIAMKSCNEPPNQPCWHSTEKLINLFLRKHSKTAKSASEQQGGSPVRFYFLFLFSMGKGHGTLSSQWLLHAVNTPSTLISAHGTGLVHYLAKVGGPRGASRLRKSL